MFVEMRNYLLKPGATAGFEERFTEGLSARAKISPFGGLWKSEVGGLNRVVHMWPYESFETESELPGRPGKPASGHPRPRNSSSSKKTGLFNRRRFLHLWNRGR